MDISQLAFLKSCKKINEKSEKGLFKLFVILARKPLQLVNLQRS